MDSQEVQRVLGLLLALVASLMEREASNEVKELDLKTDSVLVAEVRDL
jgi:hypothetical protein